MYDLRGYGNMLLDKTRMGPYTEALRRSVGPGSVVVDIGTGPGVMAMQAVKFGARRVYAIEPADAIEVGRLAAKRNGMADRITFIQALSTEVELPELADVVVADLRGALPTMPGHFDAIADARQRFLKPGGVLIPLRDRLMVAPGYSVEHYDDYRKPWEENEFDLDLTDGLRFVRNAWRSGLSKAEEVIGKPAQWALIDYLTVSDARVSGSARFDLPGGVRINGLTVWFDTDLIDGVGFSTAPGIDNVYGGGFFPLLEPRYFHTAGTLEVELRADPVGASYVWSWNTRAEIGGERKEFRQSTFFSQPRAVERMRLRAADHAPTLNEDGQIDAFILGCMQTGTMTIGEIADQLVIKFPDRFADRNTAIGRAGDLATTYAKPGD